MNNPVIENMLSRRSIRRFKKDQLTKEELDTILLAATYAPSGSNSQSWLFTVVQNEGLLLELNKCVSESVKKISFDDNYPAKNAAKKRAEDGTFMMYYNAPTLIIVSNLRDYTNNRADSACALENIFLSANSLGIGSCWINQINWVCDEEPTRSMLRRLEIPDSHIVCGSAALGYPLGEAMQAAPRREGVIRYFI